MARIPDGEIERLKRDVSVERLAESRGVKLKRHGADLMGLCPFHDDHSPSLVISPRKNLWNCLGACRAGGSVIDWVMRAEGISFRHAVELLREDHLPAAVNPSAKPPRVSTVPKLPPPISRDADDRVLLLEVVRYYNEALKQSPEALKYLESRGLQSSEMTDRFQLGFANRTLGYTLPRKNRVAGAEMRGRLQKIGILRESGHEHFNGSVVIPICNPAGEAVQMYGRKITKGLRDGTPLHLYLPSPLCGVWNEQALAASKEIILCEAIIDALTFWCAGYRNVTTSYGVNGFTDDHRAAFRKYGTKKIYIAYDRDDAGEGASAELAEELIGMGIECFRVQFPKGMDANEYALKVTPAAKSLGILLNKATWFGKGKPSTVAVSELQVAVKEPKSEPAAKEEITEPAENLNLPLAACSAEPIKEAAPVAAEIPVPIPAAAQEEISAPPMNVLPLTEQEQDERAELPPSVRMSSSVAPYMQVEAQGEEVLLAEGNRQYRVRGLGKNLSYELLKINLLVSRTDLGSGSGFHVDTFDLYSARQRAVFSKQAAEELGVKEELIRRDLGQVLRHLELLQSEQIKKTLEKPAEQTEISAEDRAAALNLLRDPKLLDRILADFERCGMVGEQTNKLAGYLAVTSRLLESPLAVLVQASSAAGKSALMEAVLAFLPEEQRVQYSAMTGQSLFYMGETDLKNKVLGIVEEEGALRAAYALKLLQSEGVLTIASTGKDATTGRLVTHQYRVEGPVMIFLTTTAIDLDEELLNRCLVLTVDEDRAQTQAIHRQQREAQTIEGLLAKQEREEILKLHRNAQRLLEPIFVANPYARELTFLDHQTRTRRDHTKYLTLIRSIALLHQYQREKKTASQHGKTIGYIEVTKEDIAVANRLTEEVLGRSLDELPPQTRLLLLLLDEMVNQQCERQKMERADFRFSRKDVRQHTAWSDSQLKRHLHRLEELEYLLAHHGGRGQNFVYELVYERRDGSEKLVVTGLIGVEKLQNYAYDEKKSGVNGEKSAPSLPQSRGVLGGGAGNESPILAQRNGDFACFSEKRTSREHREKPIVIVENVVPIGAGGK